MMPQPRATRTPSLVRRLRGGLGYAVESLLEHAVGDHRDVGGAYSANALERVCEAEGLPEALIADGLTAYATLVRRYDAADEADPYRAAYAVARRWTRMRNAPRREAASRSELT